MNYPISFYHPSQQPRLSCTKFRNCRRTVFWPYGLGYRLLGHATLSIKNQGIDLQVIYLENGFGIRKVVIPDKSVKLWQQIEHSWHGDASIWVVARTAIDAWLARAVAPPICTARKSHGDSPLPGIRTELELSDDELPI